MWGGRRAVTVEPRLLRNSLLQLRKAAQHLGHRPCLSHAAARNIRRLGVEDFADRADTGFGERDPESFPQRQCPCSACPRMVPAFASTPSSVRGCSRIRRAFYQRALIPTALPRRGVTTHPSTLASIQVSW